MNFLEALDFCKQTGKSITIARYTPESQATVQWYLDHDGILVCQNNNGRLSVMAYQPHIGKMIG